VRFTEMMDLAEHGPDTYVARGPEYPWGGLYGGQIVAQGLRAAARTVPADFAVHSLHAYFIRRGDATSPIRFQVGRDRDGRSFATRSVEARQDAGALLTMVASFQRGAATEQVQTAEPPDAPGPDGLERDGWTPMFERSFLPAGTGMASAWLRVPDLDDDPVLAACALAYLSDDLCTDAVRSQQGAHMGDGAHAWSGISLDHAIWFQGGPLEASGWQLHHFRTDGLLPPRGLAFGHVFDIDGNHRATVTQEVLLRPRTP
jgi:acyl-CoA thioesterase-2